MVDDDRQRLVALADAFVAEDKRLVGYQPRWRLAARDNTVECRWEIAYVDSVTRGQLVLVRRRNDPTQFSASALFRRKPVYRLDIVPDDYAEGNPLWARATGCPPAFRGSQEHLWADNRNHILTSPVWELGAKRPIVGPVRTLRQVVHVVAQALNIVLEPGQADISGPTEPELDL